MIINENIKPYPSDFANYVYCNAQWALEKRYRYRLPGEDKNEDKCIDWVLNKFNFTKKQIVFNGTGKNNCNFLTSEIESLCINMRCKPDLIISNKGKNLLYEFKSVDRPHYLKLPEFDSVHAQVWCYTKIKELPIDEYHLLRYHNDPTMFSFYYIPYRYKILTPWELDSHKFKRLFEKYIEAINLLNNHITKADKLSLTLINSPKENKYQKCYNCRFKIKNICPLE